MAKQKPEHIRAALQVLEDLRTHAPEQESAFRQILPVFAAKAAQSGEAVTEDFLKEHIAQGKDHLQDFVKNLHPQKQGVEETALAQYEKIKAALPIDLEDLNQALVMAILSNRLDTVKNCVQQGANVEYFSEPWLIVAAESGHLDMVKYCLELAGDTQENNETILTVAAQNGHLPIVKYCVEKGYDSASEKTAMLTAVLTIAAMYNQLSVVQYCIEHRGCNDPSNTDMALHYAAQDGHFDLVQYCLEQGGNIEKFKNQMLDFAAKAGRLDIIKDCVKKGAHIKRDEGTTLRLAAVNGHLHIVQYIFEQDGDLQNLQNTLNKAALANHLDIVKYCVEQGADLRAAVGDRNEKDYTLRIAVAHNAYKVIKYCLEQGCDINNIAWPHSPEDLLNRLDKYDHWTQKHGTCPRGLLNYSPHYFKANVFADILPILSQEGYKNEIAHLYAYNAAGLFGSTKRVLTYLEKWGEYSRQPLHDIIQDIDLPQQGRFNNSAWADAVLKHGPKMARLVKFADKLPEPLKNDDGSWSYLKTRQEIAKFAYPKGTLNPELAAICFQYDWDDEVFDDALGHIEEYQKTYAANDNKKPKAHIPDIKIDGAEFDKTGYLFYKLPDGDLRGLFLGEFTNCCQHLAGLGAACASHGFLNKYSGFYAIESKETGEIIAQSWAWRGKDKALVLDSLESLSGHFNARQWQKLTKKLAAKIAENAADITALHIGTGGATPRLGFKKAAVPSKPKEYNKHRDSHYQYQVWKRFG